ncbi:hypothetical protein Tco_0992513 [Tanacetum coccineum]|uniref:Uncharacterized protein n=1 Tax=Tanacetum coccineum TaxID=301880 RepID=A0ABQ5F350_9ASTR
MRVERRGTEAIGDQDAGGVVSGCGDVLLRVVVGAGMRGEGRNKDKSTSGSGRNNLRMIESWVCRGAGPRQLGAAAVEWDGIGVGCDGIMAFLGVKDRHGLNVSLMKRISSFVLYGACERCLSRRRCVSRRSVARGGVGRRAVWEFEYVSGVVAGWRSSAELVCGGECGRSRGDSAVVVDVHRTEGLGELDLAGEYDRVGGRLRAQLMARATEGVRGVRRRAMSGGAGGEKGGGGIRARVGGLGVWKGGGIAGGRGGNRRRGGVEVGGGGGSYEADQCAGTDLEGRGELATVGDVVRERERQVCGGAGVGRGGREITGEDVSEGKGGGRWQHDVDRRVEDGGASNQRIGKG